MQNFAYLLVEEKSKEAMGVDSGWETAPIVKVAKENDMRVRYVCATHSHYDHVKTIDALAKELGAETVAHERAPLSPDVRVRDGDALRLGESEVKVIYTPGHTEDSVCFYDGRNLLTGDTLFIGAWGRTDLAGGSAATLFSSLHDRIMKLPRDTLIYSGHDYGEVRFRTIGEEAKKNPALLARSGDEFARLTQD